MHGFIQQPNGYMPVWHCPSKIPLKKLTVFSTCVLEEEADHVLGCVYSLKSTHSIRFNDEYPGVHDDGTGVISRQ
jgi:hypothetical protein